MNTLGGSTQTFSNVFIMTAHCVVLLARRLAFFALQQEAFAFATRDFEVTDDQLLEFYDRVGSALGVEPKRRDPWIFET